MLFDNKANEIGKALLERNETISVAESVTSGYVQALLSSAVNAEQFYQGGITAYNLGQKCKHLAIEPVAAKKNNCVSEDVAKQMSIGVNKLFLSDYGVSITGYAAPYPEENIQDVFAYFAIGYNDKIIESGRLSSQKDTPELVQIDYAQQVLEKLYNVIKTNLTADNK